MLGLSGVEARHAHRAPSPRYETIATTAANVAGRAVETYRRDRHRPGQDVVRDAAYRSTHEHGPAPASASTLAKYQSWLPDVNVLITAVTHQAPHQLPDHIVVVDRRGMVDAMMTSIDPKDAHTPKSWLLRQLSGDITGYYASRTLGMYVPEWQAGDGTTALYMVEPNIQQFARDLGVPADALARSILIHEATHHWQFTEHPWLNSYLEDLSEQVKSVTPQQMTSHPSDPAAAIPGFSQMQAAMTLIEGYSDFVMETVGRKQIPGFAAVEAAMEQHRQETSTHRSVGSKVVGLLTGMDAKMRQYADGKQFAAEVVATGGLDLLNHVWDGPDALPTMDELKQPQLWVSRMRASLPSI